MATQTELIRLAGELPSRRPQDFAGREKSMARVLLQYKGSKVPGALFFPFGLRRGA